MNIRAATLADLAAIVQIENACFTVPWSEQSFYNEFVRNQFARYLVVECDGRIVAYGGVWIIVDEAHITNVAVHPDYQGRKIGRRLMEKLMEIAAAEGATSMTLEVRPSNRVARTLYESLGFAVTGVRRGYYPDNGEDALIMWVKLS
jgi:ribosomal-protein-alanine N-acetyltransferase